MFTEKRNIYILSFGSAIRTFGTGAVWGFTPLYLNDVLDVSLLIVGLVFAINAIFGGFIQIYAGHLGDKYGHKRMILIFATGYTTTLFSLFLSSVLFPVPIIFISLFLLNQIIGSLIRPSLNALLSLSSDVPLSGFSFMRVAANLGWAFGPAMGGLVIAVYGYPFIYLIAAITTVASLPLFILLRDKKGLETEVRKFSFRNAGKGLYAFGIGTAFLFVVVSQFSVTLPIYANHIENLGALSIGLIYFVNGIVVATFQLPVYYVIKRIGLWNGIIMGAVLYIIGYFSMAFDRSLPEFMLSMFVVTMGENAVTPTGNAVVSKISAGKNLGTNMGVYNFFNSFGRGLGPTYGSFLLSSLIDPYKIWGLAVTPAFVAIAVFLMNKSRESKKRKQRIVDI